MTNGSPNYRPPKTGWLWIDNRAFDLAAAIGRLALLVYSVLVRHSNAQRVCEMRSASIAKVIQVSDRSVRREVSKLVAAGLVRVQGKANRTGRTVANCYHLLTPPVPPVGEADTSGHPRTRRYF